jgi:hypothetical protein
MTQVDVKCIERRYGLTCSALEAKMSRISNETDMLVRHYLYSDFVEIFQYIIKSVECEERNCINIVFSVNDKVLKNHYCLSIFTFCNRPDALKGTTDSARAWEAIMYRHKQVLEALKVQEAYQLEVITSSFSRIRKALYDLSTP